MIQLTQWEDIPFPTGLPATLTPLYIERLRGTLLRLDAKLGNLQTRYLNNRVPEEISILEHIGHLIQVEVLWNGRLEDFGNKLAVLREANPESYHLRDEDFNGYDLNTLLRIFAFERNRLIYRLERTGEDELTFQSYNPTINQPINVVDQIHIAATHDDYHLARINRIILEMDKIQA